MQEGANPPSAPTTLSYQVAYYSTLSFCPPPSPSKKFSPNRTLRGVHPTKAARMSQWGIHTTWLQKRKREKSRQEGWGRRCVACRGQLVRMLVVCAAIIISLRPISLTTMQLHAHLEQTFTKYVHHGRALTPPLIDHHNYHIRAAVQPYTCTSKEGSVASKPHNTCKLGIWHSRQECNSLSECPRHYKQNYHAWQASSYFLMQGLLLIFAHLLRS